MNIGVKILGMSAVSNLLGKYLDFAGTGSASYVVGTDVEYAPYVEFGTYKMQAQPYMRPAAEEVRGNIPRYLSQASTLDEAVRSAALDIESRAKTYCPVDTGNLRGSIQTVEQ